MFNYGTYLNNGGNTGAANPITGAGGADACLTSTDPKDSRLERLKGLFAFLAQQGCRRASSSSVTAAFRRPPTITPRPAGLPGAARLLRPARRGLARHGQRTVNQHGAAPRQRGQDPGLSTTSAREAASPRRGQSAATPTRSPRHRTSMRSARSRSRAASAPSTSTTTPVSSTPSTSTTACSRPRGRSSSSAPTRVTSASSSTVWSFGRPQRASRAPPARSLINNNPTRITQLHVKDGTGIVGQGTGARPIAAPARRSRPGTGELDFRPIFATARGKVQYYHHEHDGGAITDANTSFTNLKGHQHRRRPGRARPADGLSRRPAAGVQSSKALTIKNTGDAPAHGHERRPRQQLETRARAALPGVRARRADVAFLGRQQHLCRQARRARRHLLGPGRLQAHPHELRLGGACGLVVSNADNATESILLTGSSSGESQGSVGGDVPDHAVAEPVPGGDHLREPSCRLPPARTTSAAAALDHQHGRQRDPVGRRVERKSRPATWSTARSRWRSRCRSGATNAANPNTGVRAAERDRGRVDDAAQQRDCRSSRTRAVAWRSPRRSPRTSASRRTYDAADVTQPAQP